jgi:hypothetical protein
MPRGNGSERRASHSGFRTCSTPRQDCQLLDSVRDAALEETVPLEAGIVSLRVHDPSHENGIALARRCILCGPRLGNSYLNPPFGQKTVGAFGVSGWVETDLE